MKLNPIYLVDFYKFGHREQYPQDTEKVYTTWTPRATRVDEVDRVVNLGLQY